MNKNWYIALELPIYPPTQDENVIRLQIDKIREQCAENNDSEFTKEFWQALPKIRKDMLGNKNKREKLIKEINEEIIPKIEESAKKLFLQDSLNNSNFDNESNSLNIPVSYIKTCYNNILQADNEIQQNIGNVNNIEISQQYNISTNLVEYLVGLNGSESKTNYVPTFNGTTQEAIDVILGSLKNRLNVTQDDFININAKYGIPLDFIEEVYKQFLEEKNGNNMEFTGTTQEAIDIILGSLKNRLNVTQDDFININTRYGIPLDFIEEVYKQYFNTYHVIHTQQDTSVKDTIKQKLENISLTRSVNRNDILNISQDLNVTTDTVLNIYNELYPDDPIIMNLSYIPIPKPTYESIKKEPIKSTSNTDINRSEKVLAQQSAYMEWKIFETLSKEKGIITKDTIKKISKDLNAPIDMVLDGYNELYPDKPIIMNLSSKPTYESIKKEPIKNTSNTDINRSEKVLAQQSAYMEWKIFETLSKEKGIITKDTIKKISKDLNAPIDMVLDGYNELLYPDKPIIMNLSYIPIPKPTYESIKKEPIKNKSNTTVNRSRIAPSKPSPLVELITREISNRGTENITKDIIKEISEDLNAPISMVKEVYQNISDLPIGKDSTSVKIEEKSNITKNTVPVKIDISVKEVPTKPIPVPIQVPVAAPMTFIAPTISVSVTTDSTNRLNTITWTSMFDKNQSSDLNSMCTYSIIRKVSDIPQKYTDGECIADNITENYFQDTTIENGLEYGYSVFPVYNGNIYNENIGKCNNRVRNIFDINPEDISIISENKAVKISWSNIPKGASIKIQKDNQMLNINTSLNNFKDTAVWNGQTYVYKVYLMHDILGRQYTTNSLEYKVTPMPNINPIKDYNTYISDDDTILLNYKYENPSSDSDIILYSYSGEDSTNSILNNIYKYSINDIPKELSVVTKQNLKDSDTIKISKDFSNSTIILGVVVNNCVVLSGIVDISTLEKNSRYTISSLNLDGNGNLSISYECDDNNNIKFLNRIIIMKSNSNFKSLANINDNDNIIIKDNFETRGMTSVQGIKNDKYYISMVCEYKQFDTLWYSKIDEHTFNNVERLLIYYSFKKPSIFNNKLEIFFEQPENKNFSLKDISIHANVNTVPMIISDSNTYVQNLPDINSVGGKCSIKINGSKIKRLCGVLVSNNKLENESFILRLKPNTNNNIS